MSKEPYFWKGPYGKKGLSLPSGNGFANYSFTGEHYVIHRVHDASAELDGLVLDTEAEVKATLMAAAERYLNPVSTQ